MRLCGWRGLLGDQWNKFYLYKYIYVYIFKHIYMGDINNPVYIYIPYIYKHIYERSVE